MRVLILHQYFFPDISANSQYLTDLAGDLAARGHEVTVITSRAVQHGDKGFAAPFERVGRVAVYRTPATNLGKGTIAARVVDYSSFLATAALRAAVMRHQDVVLVVTTPPLLPVLGPLLRAFRGSRFVYLCEDVYPDIAVRMGKLREGAPLERLVRRLVGWSQRTADRVIVIGRCMRDLLVAHGVEPGRLVVIPNWADPEEIHPIDDASNPMAIELGLVERFGLVYSGNMGWGHDFATFLGAAERLRDDGAVRFVFIGDGYRRAEVERTVRLRSLANVMMVPYQSRERLIHSLNLGAAGLVSQRSEVDGLLVPSKLYALLAAAKPVLFVGSRSCEVGRTVLEVGCGFVIGPGDVDGLLAAIATLRVDDRARRAMGARGRAALLERFQRRIAVDAYERVLQEAVEERRTE